MTASNGNDKRKPRARRWRLRPDRSRPSPAAFAPIGEQIADRLRRSELRAVIDPAGRPEAGTPDQSNE
jgi:hypothetical protein